MTGVSDIRTRLRRALGDALKARDASTVSALRSALSAIGNAETVDPGPARPAGTGSAHFAGTVPRLGAGEAERRHLTEADAAAIVRTEAAEREAAASEYERGGHAAEAARLRHGIRALLAPWAAPNRISCAPPGLPTTRWPRTTPGGSAANWTPSRWTGRCWAGFAELVQAAGAGPVADIGCGTGRVTAHLRALGEDLFRPGAGPPATFGLMGPVMPGGLDLP